jgi:hypothetical protein
VPGSDLGSAAGSDTINAAPAEAVGTSMIATTEIKRQRVRDISSTSTLKLTLTTLEEES